MSALVAVGAGALLLAYLSQPTVEKPKERPKPDVISNTTPVATQFLRTGTYGDHEDLSSMLKFPGMVVKVRHDVDLSGTPCRWLTMRNGAHYRVYDMDTEYY